MPVQLITSSFPFVTLSYVGKSFTDQEVIGSGLQVIGLLQRKEVFAFISDMRQGAPSPKQGDALAEMMEQHRNEFRTYCAGNCLVITNPAIRALLRIALLAKKPPFHVGWEPSMVQAEAWIRGAYAEKMRGAA